MSLENLGNIGEFVGAIAVVLSLIYLAVQIRQNTRSVRASTQHSVMRAANELNSLFGASGSASHIFYEGLRESKELTAEERFRFHILIRGLFALHQDAFTQMRRHTIDKPLWLSARATLQELLGRPGAIGWWKRYADNFTDEFQEEVSLMLAGADSQAAARGEGE